MPVAGKQLSGESSLMYPVAMQSKPARYMQHLPTMVLVLHCTTGMILLSQMACSLILPAPRMLLHGGLHTTICRHRISFRIIIREVLPPGRRVSRGMIHDIGCMTGSLYIIWMERSEH